MGRQALQVAVEMLLDLALGLDDEAQAGTVAQARRAPADRKRACIPERIEQRGPVAEFLQALLGPGEMVCLLARGFLELLAQPLVAGGQRLRGVERLRADLADMVHPHQRAREPAFGLVQLRRLGHGLRVGARCRPAGMVVAPDGAQALVHDRHQAVDRRECDLHGAGSVVGRR